MANEFNIQKGLKIKNADSGFASGNTATAVNNSFAQGRNATAAGTYGCFAQGNNTTAAGNNGSFAIGSSVTNTASSSFAMGTSVINQTEGRIVLNNATTPLVWISELVDFTQEDTAALTWDIFTVPTNASLMIDSYEMITTNILTPGTPPTIIFGDDTDVDSIQTATLSNSNSNGARHIFEQPKDLIDAGTVITGGVTIGSTAATHQGRFLVKGTIIEV